LPFLRLQSLLVTLILKSTLEQVHPIQQFRDAPSESESAGRALATSMKSLKNGKQRNSDILHSRRSSSRSRSRGRVVGADSAAESEAASPQTRMSHMKSLKRLVSDSLLIRRSSLSRSTSDGDSLETEVMPKPIQVYSSDDLGSPTNAEEENMLLHKKSEADAQELDDLRRQRTSASTPESRNAIAEKLERDWAFAAATDWAVASTNIKQPSVCHGSCKHGERWTPEDAAKFAALRDFQLIKLLSKDRRAEATAGRLGVFARQPEQTMGAYTSSARETSASDHGNKQDSESRGQRREARKQRASRHSDAKRWATLTSPRVASLRKLVPGSML
jgi:hypothetical protein